MAEKQISPRGRISSLLISIFHWVLYINELFQGVIAQKAKPFEFTALQVYAFIQRDLNTWKQPSPWHTSSKHISTSRKINANMTPRLFFQQESILTFHFSPLHGWINGKGGFYLFLMKYLGHSQDRWDGNSNLAKYEHIETVETWF